MSLRNWANVNVFWEDISGSRNAEMGELYRCRLKATELVTSVGQLRIIPSLTVCNMP
jgi:hypothetical protein